MNISGNQSLETITKHDGHYLVLNRLLLSPDVSQGPGSGLRVARMGCDVIDLSSELLPSARQSPPSLVCYRRSASGCDTTALAQRPVTERPARRAPGAAVPSVSAALSPDLRTEVTWVGPAAAPLRRVLCCCWHRAEPLWSRGQDADSSVLAAIGCAAADARCRTSAYQRHEAGRRSARLAADDGTRVSQ